jgi:hypothetical protein
MQIHSASLCRKHFQERAAKPQVPPLRCAPVGMTRGRGYFSEGWRFGWTESRAECVDEPYSPRRAWIGSTDAARRAGNADAARAKAKTVIAVRTTTAGSKGPTSHLSQAVSTERFASSSRDTADISRTGAFLIAVRYTSPSCSLAMAATIADVSITPTAAIHPITDNFIRGARVQNWHLSQFFEETVEFIILG